MAADETPVTPTDLNETPLQATIDFFNVPVPSLPPLADAVDETEDAYLSWGQTVMYVEDRGYAVQPVAGAGREELTEITRTHSGVCQKIVQGVATRIGKNPTIPHPDTGSPNEILIQKTVAFFSPPKLPDGSVVRGAIWNYVYALQIPPGDNDPLDSGKTPMDEASMAQYVVNPAEFSRYLIGPASSVTSPKSIFPINY